MHRCRRRRRPSQASFARGARCHGIERLKRPHYQLCQCLNANIRGLAVALNAIAEKKKRINGAPQSMRFMTANLNSKHNIMEEKHNGF